MSIKLKIALLNTIFMIIIVLLVLVFMIIISNDLTDLNIKTQLTDVVEYNIEKIKYDKNAFNLEDLDLYKKEVYSYIYSQNGILLSSYKSDVPNIDIELKNKILSIHTVGNDEYYIYDLLVENKVGENIWIRGITLANDESQVVLEVLLIAFITLPFFVIIAGVGCYIISKKALNPIQKIVNTVNLIKNSDDLSKRINLGNRNDEVHSLSCTFDEMFDSLEKAFEKEKQFSSDVSHELRTPTSVILAQCEYALDENTNIEEKQISLEVIQRQSIKMKKLITNLLNLSKIDNGLEKIDIQKNNLSQLILILCEEQACIKEKNIKLKFDIEDNIYVNIDNDLIIRMITNLISNAYKYGVENGNIYIKLKKENNETLLYIKDDGIGIKKENIEKIWNRFYQVDSSRTNNSGSMGLGLAMVQKIIKIHNAKIEVDSEINKGTCFKIIF